MEGGSQLSTKETGKGGWARNEAIVLIELTLELGLS